ncbi:MAG: ABC transporter permease, partial [Chloroflexota bacterium]|nr:ABC transporter permease [Chloroflexota bacterium]
TWIMAVLLAGIIALPYIITLTVPNTKDNINKTPLLFLTNQSQGDLAVLRVFLGIYLIILMARVIGLEYQLGTIRVLLSRGVGRLQLLLAKLLTVGIIGLLLFIVGLVYNAILLTGLLAFTVGNLNAFNAITSTFWSDTWTYMLTVLLSMGVTILMATAVSVLGRSLAFGLSAAVIWFPIDNIGEIFLFLANRITHNDFWLNVTAYLLGPNLNVMPGSILSPQAFTIGAPPYVQVDGTHTVVVALVYAAIFAVVAFVLTWRRDVKE